MTKRIFFSTITLGLFIGWGTATNADVVEQRDMTEGTESFGPEEGEFLSFVTLSAAAPLGDFTVSYSGIGEDQLTINWNAPAGTLIRVTPPADLADSSRLRFFFTTQGVSVGTGSYQDDVASFQFSDFSGAALPAPATQRMTLSGPGGSDVTAFLQFNNLTPGASLQFSRLSMTTTVPTDYNVDFDSAITEFLIEGLARSSSPTPPADPGQWIQLVSIPEPASAAMLAIGGFALLRRKTGTHP